MADPKPLSQWIIESINEELVKLGGDPLGREVYLRGWERCEEANAIRTMAERLRELRRNLPLLPPKDDGRGGDA